MSIMIGNTPNRYPPVQNGKQKRPGLVTLADYLRIPSAAYLVKLDALAKTHIQATGSGTGAVAGSTFTPIIFNAEFGDTLGEYNTANGQFIPLAGGIYELAAFYQFSGLPSGVRTILSLYENGVEIRRLFDRNQTYAGGQDLGQAGALQCTLTGGATYTMRAFHTNAAALNIVNNAALCWWHITRLT